MLRIKSHFPLELLRKYGFKLGREWPKYRNYISNVDYDDFFFFPMDPDEPEDIYLTECGLPLWKVHVIPEGWPAWAPGTLLIDCVPDATYHIGSMEMEQLLSVLFHMIQAGVIEDIDTEGTVTT